MRRLLLVLVLLQLWWGGLQAQTPPPPAPQRWVTDTEGFLTPAAKDRLDARLANYQHATGHSVLVWIGASTGGAPLEDFTVRAFEAWKVGRKGMDDGLVLFILAKDQKLRMEVGYGLEGQMPDALASRIIRETIIPVLKTGDRDRAVLAGAGQILKTLGGEVNAPPTRERGLPQLGVGGWILVGLAGAGFLILFITNPGLAVWLLFSLMSGGRGGGGGGGGGGGWSGGGGRSGGGGASGSW